MEQRSLFVSVLGVGVGLGLASARWAALAPGGGSGAAGAEEEAELRRLLVDGRETGVTFDGFPYYLSDHTRVVLASAAYVHLKQEDLSKHIRNF